MDGSRPGCVSCCFCAPTSSHFGLQFSGHAVIPLLARDVIDPSQQNDQLGIWAFIKLQFVRTIYRAPQAVATPIFGLSKEFPRHTATVMAPSSPRGEFFIANGSTVPAMPPWVKADKADDLAVGWPGPPVGGVADTTTTSCGTA